MRRPILLLAALILAGYVAAGAYVRFNETDLVFPREVSPGGLPAPADSLHLPVREVNFTTADSVRLSAWIIPSVPADSTGFWILICHGQTGHVATTTRPEYYAKLRAIGVNIFAFDWRGFGASEGTPTEAGLYRDATAAYAYLRDVAQVPTDRIIIFGHSLGTAPAVELATRVPAAALILEGGPSSIRGRAQELYPWLPMRVIASVDFNSLGLIADVSMPKLFIHSADDAKIPIAHGRALFERAREPKRFAATRGDHHNIFQRDSATYFGEFRRFVVSLDQAKRDPRTSAATAR